MPEPGDATWKDFDAAEQARQAEIELQYQVIEGFNRALLNQVAGIEDDHLDVVEASPKGESEEPQKHLTLLSAMPSLYLKPALTPETIGKDAARDPYIGDPYVIAGEIPPRSQQLIDDMLAGIEASLDEGASTPGEEIWRGNIAGVPIEIRKIRQISVSKILDQEERTPILSMQAFAVNRF